MSPVFLATDFFAAALNTALLHKNVHEFNVVPQTHQNLAHRAFSASLYRNGESPTSCTNILCVKGTVKPKGTQMTVGSNSFCRVKQLGVLVSMKLIVYMGDIRTSA